MESEACQNWDLSRRFYLSSFSTSRSAILLSGIFLFCYLILLSLKFSVLSKLLVSLFLSPCFLVVTIIQIKSEKLFCCHLFSYSSNIYPSWQFVLMSSYTLVRVMSSSEVVSEVVWGTLWGSLVYLLSMVRLRYSPRSSPRFSSLSLCCSSNGLSVVFSAVVLFNGLSEVLFEVVLFDGLSEVLRGSLRGRLICWGLCYPFSVIWCNTLDDVVSWYDVPLRRWCSGTEGFDQSALSAISMSILQCKNNICWLLLFGWEKVRQFSCYFLSSQFSMFN